MRIAEHWVNGAVLIGIAALPLWALLIDEPFTITLVTRAVILALAAVGLNIVLGFGGLVSFGHAVFFGLGGYAMGILAYQAQTYTVLDLGFFTTEGTKSMPIIWLVAMGISAIAAFFIGLLCLRTSGVYFIMITDCSKRKIRNRPARRDRFRRRPHPRGPRSQPRRGEARCCGRGRGCCAPEVPPRACRYGTAHTHT